MVSKWRIHWHLRKNPTDKLKNIMTIGIYKGNAFLIKDMNKLVKAHVCTDCRARFTQACHLQRHAKTCAQGRAINECPNKWDEAPQTVHERTFNEHQASAAATRWLERTSKLLDRRWTAMTWLENNLLIAQWLVAWVPPLIRRHSHKNRVRQNERRALRSHRGPTKSVPRGRLLGHW